jgi:hypothetical protein
MAFRLSRAAVERVQLSFPCPSGLTEEHLSVKKWNRQARRPPENKMAAHFGSLCVRAPTQQERCYVSLSSLGRGKSREKLLRRDRKEFPSNIWVYNARRERPDSRSGVFAADGCSPSC